MFRNLLNVFQFVGKYFFCAYTNNEAKGRFKKKESET